MGDKIIRRKRLVVKIKSREHHMLYEHGVCFNCGGRFLLTPNCAVCAGLELLFARQSRKVLLVREIGPTRLSKEIFDPALDFGDLIAWAGRERDVFCRFYSKCLDIADGWKSFTCRWCRLKTINLT